MYAHPWWIHWRSTKNDFLRVVLAAYCQYEYVIPRLDGLHQQTPEEPSWEEIATRIGWGKDQMERIRRQTDKSKRKAARFEFVTDAPFASNTGGLSFGILADLARFFGVEVTEFIPPLSVYYTGATRFFIKKVIEESGNDAFLINEFPPMEGIWAYAQYYISLKWKDVGRLAGEGLDQETVAEVLSKDGSDAYFEMTKCKPFGFTDEHEVEAAVRRTRTGLDNLLAWLEARNLFHRRSLDAWV